MEDNILENKGLQVLAVAGLLGGGGYLLYRVLKKEEEEPTPPPPPPPETELGNVMATFF